MFGHSPGRPRGAPHPDHVERQQEVSLIDLDNGFGVEDHSLQHQAFQRFGLSHTPAVATPSHQPSHHAFDPAMMWTPAADVDDATAQTDNMGLEELAPAGPGVSNLIAHFENIKSAKPTNHNAIAPQAQPTPSPFAGAINPSRVTSPAADQFAAAARIGAVMGRQPPPRMASLGGAGSRGTGVTSPVGNQLVDTFGMMDETTASGPTAGTPTSPFGAMGGPTRLSHGLHLSGSDDFAGLHGTRVTSPMADASTSPFGTMSLSTGIPSPMGSPTVGGYGSLDELSHRSDVMSASEHSPFGALPTSARISSPVQSPSADDFINMGIAGRMMGPFGNNPITAPFQNMVPIKIEAPLSSPPAQSYRNVSNHPTVTTPGSLSGMGFGGLATGKPSSPLGSPAGSHFGSIGAVASDNPSMSQTNVPPNQGYFHPAVPPKPIAQPSAASRGSTPGFKIWRPPVPTKPKPVLGHHQPQAQQKQQTQQTQPPLPARPTQPAQATMQSYFQDSGIKLEGDVDMEDAAPHHQFDTISTPSTSTMRPIPIEKPQPQQQSTTFSIQNPGTIALKAQQGSRPSRELVPAESWETYKPTIRQLYLEERRPLKEVMQLMAERHGFQATPKMYKTRFSQWGFVKNNTEEEVKRLLSMKFQRDAKGKVSEFMRNGRVINLGTYLKRKGVTEYDLVDFETPADLPSYVRCRTPTPPPAPGYLRSPDLLRAQETVVGNMRKAFLHCRQVEGDTNTAVGWTTIMLWGAGSSDLLYEASKRFERGETDQGGSLLIEAFKQLEVDLKKLSPQGIKELLLGMVHRDPGMTTALSKYLAAYSTTNYERSHPLRQIFTTLYEVQQKHGPATLSDLVWGCIPTIAEELEAIYGRKHPYVARTWIDLAAFYGHADPARLDKLIQELQSLRRAVETKEGQYSAEDLALGYAILQLTHSAGPDSDATRLGAVDLWNAMKASGRTYAVRHPDPNTFCFHDPVKVNPWTKRCKERYTTVVELLRRHAGVTLLPYFEEEMHSVEHAPDPQDAWAAAMEHLGSGRYGLI